MNLTALPFDNAATTNNLYHTFSFTTVSMFGLPIKK